MTDIHKPEIRRVCSFYTDDNQAVNFVGCSTHHQSPVSCANALQKEVEALRERVEQMRSRTIVLERTVQVREKEAVVASNDKTKLAAWLRSNHPEIFKAYFLEFKDDHLI